MKKITFLAAFLVVFSMNAQIFFDDFNSEVVDEITFTNWLSLDEDGDSNFWEVFDADGTAYPWLMSGLGADSDSWEGAPFEPDNYLITIDPIDLTGVTGTMITYLVGTYQTNGMFIDDLYSIYMSTSNSVVDILAEGPIETYLVSDHVTASAGDGSDSAAEVTVDASAYDGQIVYLTFRHYDSIDVNSVLLDDVTVDGVLAVGDESLQALAYSVNANELSLRNNLPLENIQIYNVLGQEVLSQKLFNTVETVNISALTSGVYLANVTADGQSRTIRILKR